MKKIHLSLLFVILASLYSLAQNTIQGSIQQGTSLNSVNVTFLPNHNSTVGEYANYVSISIAIPTASATGVVPTITGAGNFAPLTFVPANPFSYTLGTETIFSWIAANGTPFAMSWSNGVAFTGATISFCGGTGVAKVRLIDLTNLGGGNNGNTVFGVGVNVAPFDLTNYVNHFYSISGTNGSITGTYGNGDQYVETNALITMTCILCQPPQNLQANPITATTADITWNPVSGAVVYEYQYGSNPLPNAGGPNFPHPTNSIQLTPLTPSTLYYFHVRTDCGAGLFSQWTTIQFTTEALNCPAPAPVVSAIGTTTANINWDSVMTAIGYEYVLNNDPANPPIGILGTTTDTFHYPPNNLAPGTLYYIHVRSDCGSGYYSNWVGVPFTTICPAPPIPSVSLITSTGATVTWNAVTGASSYQYEFSTSSTPSGAWTATTALSVTRNDLSVGTVYYFHLRVQCSPGIFSVPVSAPFTTVCPATATPSVTDISTNSATISWPLITGVSLYQYAVTTSDTAPGTGTITAYDTAYSTGLLPGTLYYVYVRTQCSPGVYSQWSFTTFTTLCPSPRFISISNISSTADINWGRPRPGMNDYQYVISTDSTSPVSGTAISDTNYHTLPLASYTTYYVFVRTVCSPGVYSAWIRQSFSTGCFKPEPFVISNSVTTRTADLGWYKVHGAIKYEYAILHTAASPGGSLSYTTDTVVKATDLRPGGKYYLHVRTHCSATNISEWAVMEFHTHGIGAFPSPVTNTLTIIVYGSAISNGKINIYDASGRLMKTAVLNGNRVDVDMRPFAAGIYFIRYNNGANEYLEKVLKK